MSTPQEGLSLYQLPAGSSRATRWRTLAGPDDRVVQSVSLSAGESPTVCAVWREPDGEPAADLLCYEPGSDEGRVVASPGGYGAVAVRPDGRALAWAGGGFNQTLTVADYEDGVATVRTEERYAAGQPEDAALPAGVGRLDWVTDELLAVQHEGDSDEGLGLCFYDPAVPRARDAMGFGRCVGPDKGEQDAGYYRFEGAAALSGAEVVTVERPRWCCGSEPPGPGARAVRLRPSDGKVLGVVAFPREGRDVTSVSGGPRAVVYVTSADREDAVVSVRWGVDGPGTPISGLPAGASVVAQP